MGEYRLADGFKKKAVSSLQWSQMTTHQRQEYIKKVLHMQPDNVPLPNGNEEITSQLSVPLSECDLTDVPTSVLKEVWTQAATILEKYNIIPLENDSYCMTEFDNSYTVKKTRELRIPLQLQALPGDLCPHVMVIAEKAHVLRDFLAKYKGKKNKASKAIFKKIPTNAREKPSVKRRRDANNVAAHPITGEADPNSPNHPRQPRYTAFYHNDEPFNIVFIKDHQKATQCTSCKVALPQRMPVVPWDIAFAHQERWEYPVKDAKGKVIEMKVTEKKTTNRFYCMRLECVRKLHPHFWNGLIQVQNEVSERLRESHKKLMKDIFGLQL